MRYTVKQAVEWYEREARRARLIGVDVNLAHEAADRFGLPRGDVLEAIGGAYWRRFA